MVACVSLQGGPWCPPQTRWYPSSSRCHTWRCASELEASWYWCVPTARLRGSYPTSSYTAWRYATAQHPRLPLVPLLEWLLLP